MRKKITFYYMMDGTSNDSENTTISRISELNEDMYLWMIQTIWDEEANRTTKFVVEGQKLERPNYSKKIYFSMSFTKEEDIEEQVFINLYHPMYTGNRKFDIKIGKIEDTTILNDIKEEKFYNYNKLLKYSKEDSPIFSGNLQTDNVAFSYYNDQEVLFDGSTLLEDGEYYYIYIILDDENGKYYPFEGVAPAKANFGNTGWDLTTEDIRIDNTADNENTADKFLEGIEITTPPIKTVYEEGEYFDKTGMVITAKYSDGSSKVVTNYTYEPQTDLKATDTTITIVYKENDVSKEANQRIKVTENEDETTAPGNIPNTGKKSAIMFVITTVIVIGIVIYLRYRKIKRIL